MPNPNIKIGILSQLKAQFKKQVELQYLTNPAAVRNANIEKNAKDIFDGVMKNPLSRPQIVKFGITLQDIEKILKEIQLEVTTGG